jgi:hypothetical protein
MNKTNSELFLKADLVTWFFRGILKLPPWAATVVFITMVNIPLIIAAATGNILFTRGAQIGLFEDYGWWVYQIGNFPATFYALMWLPDGIFMVINGLRHNKVILVPATEEGEAKWQTYVNGIQKLYCHWGWSVTAIVLVIVGLIVIWIPQQKGLNSWQASSPFTFWYTIIIWGILFYVGFLLIIKGIIVIAYLNRLFQKFEVVVRLLHPDGAGGLAPLGKFSVNAGYVLAIYGIGNVFGNLSEARLTGQDYQAIISQPYVLLIWLVYLLLAPLLFFLPLSVAHNGMAIAKTNYITNIADQFDKEMEQIQALLKGGAQSIKENIEKLEQLQKLHNISAKFPIWPFNTTNLIRFFSSVLSPLVLSILTILIERILNK